MPKRCHNCKSEGHLIEDCPTLPIEKKRSKDLVAESSSAEVADDEGDGGVLDSKKNPQRSGKAKKQTSSTNRRTISEEKKIINKNGN